MEGWLLGMGVVGSPPAGWLKEGCSGGLGSDMACLSDETSTDLWCAHARPEPFGGDPIGATRSAICAGQGVAGVWMAACRDAPVALRS